MNEEPKNAPYCCGQRAKWVCQTPGLAYFYCETCKKEPEADQLDFSGFSDWSGFSPQFNTPDLDTHATALPASYFSTAPTTIKIGTRVRLKGGTRAGTVLWVDAISRTAKVMFDASHLGMITCDLSDLERIAVIKP